MVIGPGTPGFGAACAGFDLDAIPPHVAIGAALIYVLDSWRTYCSSKTAATTE